MTEKQIEKFINRFVDKYIASHKEADKSKELEKKVKDILKNYRIIKGKKDYLISQLGNITINKSSPIARLKIEKTSKTNKPFKSEFDLILDKEEKIKEKIEEYNTFLSSVDSILNYLEHKAMVYDRYINKMTIEDISDKYKIEDREVKRLLRLAIDDLIVFFFPLEEII